ncbi:MULTISPECIES: hypothetical protein [Pseudomonas]|uniref:hypothetical protein n=1 Tax=Pseudomonas TaxID=286 RepID=UPI00117EB5E7|nr:MULTISPECIES: hypothetical protein [Pseudomonas]MBB4054832.1 hypothetical protein [Pseudomonas koreensis]TSB49433.1 hypothetical protein FEE99_24595 [Pseudomonas sp. ef1]
MFIKHRRRSRAEQGGKAAVSVQKTPLAGKNFFVSVNEASVARGFICNKGGLSVAEDLSVAMGFICGDGIYLWRGDLSPLACAAGPFIKSGAASRPAGINPLATNAA